MLDRKPEDTIDKVPWTFQQTLIGILFTLIPWMALAIGLSVLSGDIPERPALPPQEDMINAVINFFLATFIESAFLIAPFYFASRSFRTSSLRAQLTWQALGFRAFPVRNTLMWLVILLIGIFALNWLYQYLITTFQLPLQTNDQVILKQSERAPFTTYATLVVSALVAPLCEEIFFRGFIFAGFMRAMPLVGAVVFSSLIFAVSHADAGSFLVLFFIGVALAYLRWRTNSIWPSIILHTLNNGIGVLLIILTMHG